MMIMTRHPLDMDGKDDTNVPAIEIIEGTSVVEGKYEDMGRRNCFYYAQLFSTNGF